MKGDFSQLSFDRRRQFTGVLLQQGRVLTDADFNEQSAIYTDLLRTFIRDLVGRRWRVGDGFALTAGRTGDIAIAPGHAYLDGMLCANDAACTFLTQPNPPVAAPQDGTGAIAFLEAIERDVSAAEDPSLLEPALGGTDTSIRAQVAWQVRLLTKRGAAALVAPLAAALQARAATGDAAARADLRMLRTASAAFARDPRNCRAAETLFDLLDRAPPRLAIRAGNGYRGADNALYRVEIHDSGTAGTASFKWSRDNGSTVFAVTALVQSGADTVATVGRHDIAALRRGDWVEITDRTHVFSAAPAALHRIDRIDAASGTVTIPGPLPAIDLARGALLRRWDQRDDVNPGGTVAIAEGAWITLEHGIEIQFVPGGHYATGDYWTAAARTATQSVVWPAAPDGTPCARKPRGPCRQRAALASLSKKGRAWQVKNYRPRRRPNI